MSIIKRFHTNDRMSQIVVHGETIYISGQVAWKNRGQDCALQATEILETIEKYLQEAGSDKQHILSASVWLTDVATQLETFNQIWDKWVPQGHAPARACVQSPLVFPDFFVEVAVVAVKKQN
jgi:enamine deaminase RidA (YjgF/YER057c/UK114 family)